MADYQYLKTEAHSNGVLDVRLARPPANAVDRDMYIEIATLFRDPDAMLPGLQAIVLSGEGKHFCAGNDLDEFATMTPDNGDERMRRVREAFFAIQDCPVPVVGAVHGAALGTGLAIAASCDVLVALPDARLGLPELTVGVMGGARHLARLAPQAVVRRMYFTGEPMTAQALAEVTGAIVLAEPGRLLETAHGIAARIASFSPTAIRISKQILNRVEEMDLQNGYTAEQACTVRMSGHPDSKEALNAFKERRAPTYLPLSKEFR
jgi:enoyl-CoA hydratase